MGEMGKAGLLGPTVRTLAFLFFSARSITPDVCVMYKPQLEVVETMLLD